MSQRKKKPRRKDVNFSQAVEVVESSVRSTVRVTACSVDACHERIVTNIKELSVDILQWPLLWIDVEGLDDVPTIRAIGKLFEIPHLALEDAVTPDERPKVEFFENQAIITVRMVRIDEGTIVTDPVGIIFGSRVVITFRERFTADGFRVVRERFRMHRPQAERFGADMLCSLLLDAAVDGYFPVLEQFGERLEDLEENAINNPDRKLLSHIHDVRNDLMTLRRALWPTRDLLHCLSRESSVFVGAQARAHPRDSYDQPMELIDLMESYREIGSDLRDIYLASINSRMNDIMKVLAVVATIFMPLTFITGYFGMNFDRSSAWNMPLLGYSYGLIVAIAIMVLVTLSMSIFFWRRGWLRQWL